MDPQAPKSFWSSLTCPKQEALVIFVGGAVGFLVLGRLYAGWTYGLISAAIMLPILAALWVLHRVVKAWTEWPSRRRWVRWLKRGVDYLLMERGRERKGAFGPPDADARWRAASSGPDSRPPPDPQSVQDVAAGSSTPRQNAGNPSQAD